MINDAIAMLTLLVVMVMLTASTTKRRQQRAERQLDEMDRKLDAIMAHLGITLPEPQPGPRFPEIDELLRQGKKIEAIKVYRQRTGVGLKEAKEAVERMPAAR